MKATRWAAMKGTMIMKNGKRNWIAGLACLGWLTASPADAQAAAPATMPLGAYAHPLRAPGRLATDAAGTLYVTDPAAGQVVVFDAFGRQVQARTGLARPLGIAVDDGGNIYLGEEATGSVTVFDPRWQPLYQLGRGPGEFSLPNHLALGQAAGGVAVYVSDSLACQVKVYARGKLVLTLGGPGSQPGQFNFPAGLALSASGELFVVDQNNDRVEVFDPAGQFSREFSLVTRLGGMGMGSGGGRSQGITVDRSGRVFVVDTFQGIVRVFDAQSDYLGKIGAFGDAAGQLRSPAGIALDRYNRLAVASANNGRVQLLGLDSFVQLSATPARPFVAAGAAVSFSAQAGGPGPYRFQWKKNAQNLANSGVVTGADGATLTLAGVSPEDSGDYTVEITGPDGSLLSSAAALKVLIPPQILAQPANQTVALGSDVLVRAGAGGDDLAYQWFFNGSPLPGANGSALFIPNVQLWQQGAYTLLATNAVGSAASLPARLALVIPPPPPQIDWLKVLASGQLQLVFTGSLDYAFSIEASPDLVNWASLTNAVSQGGAFEFTDAGASTQARRFYRLRWAP